MINLVLRFDIENEIGLICCLINEIKDQILTFDMMKYRVLILNFDSKNYENN